MRLNLYSLLFAAAQLCLFGTLSNAFYADDGLDEMFRRDSGLNVIPDHYLRSFDDTLLSSISTRELVYELESRLERREKGATGAGATDTKASKQGTGKGGDVKQGGSNKPPSVERLNQSLKQLMASTKKHAKEAVAAIRKLIKEQGGVPFDEAKGGDKSGAGKGSGGTKAGGKGKGASAQGGK